MPDTSAGDFLLVVLIIASAAISGSLRDRRRRRRRARFVPMRRLVPARHIAPSPGFVAIYGQPVRPPVAIVPRSSAAIATRRAA